MLYEHLIKNWMSSQFAVGLLGDTPSPSKEDSRILSSEYAMLLASLITYMSWQKTAYILFMGYKFASGFENLVQSSSSNACCPSGAWCAAPILVANITPIHASLSFTRKYLRSRKYLLSLYQWNLFFCHLDTLQQYFLIDLTLNLQLS